jgi:hypothetical protein
MTRFAICSIFVPAAAVLAVAAVKAAPTTLAVTAVKAAPTTEPAEAPKLVTLALDPAAEPVPAFKYRLRVHYMDQTPGNAALQYYTALELYHGASKPDDADKISDWLDLPPAQLPADAIRELLDRHMATLKQTRLAARCEHCDWDYPLRTEGVSMLLPGLAPFRTLAKLIALKARFEISQNQLDGAMDDLQTGFAMARHACETPILIGDLVGYAILRIMNQQVQLWMQAPKAGNLYWALADVPAPFKDPRQALGGEESWLYSSFPALREPGAKLSPAEWNRMAEEVEKLMGTEGPNRSEWERKLKATAITVKLYPQAKKDLIASGRSPREVEAMPASQVVIMAGYEAFVRQRDDMFKWFSLPYWQARPALLEAEKRLSRPRANLEGYPFAGLLPALTRAYYNTARVDRELAASRCVEAIRLYAAANGGQLPASLGLIKAVPVPIDPITGKEFVYQLEGGQATLIAVRPEGESPKEETRYVITMRKP